MAAAAAAGVTLLALTDHDSTDGVAAAARAAHDVGIGLVAAVEISALFGAGRDLHILGYRIDPAEPRLVSALQRSRRHRERRADLIAGRLRELGFSIDPQPLERRRSGGGAIGRPHLAEAVVAAPANRARLAREGLLEPSAFLAAYLIEDRPAFVARAAPSVAEAIALIHGAGGVAVWAHPFWDIERPDRVLAALDDFRAAGLDGVEAFYVTHTEAQTRLLAERARTLGMLSTGSADFHGPHHARFSAFRAFETYGLEPALGPIEA